MSIARHWHTTAEERALRLPCDDVLPDAGETACTRAVDVAARPATIFRWLCQLRTAPYSYDWIDNLGRRSPAKLSPGLEDLALGQRVMSIFELVEFTKDEHITLVTAGVRGAPPRWIPGVAVTYHVTPSETGSRLLARLLMRLPAGPLGRLWVPALAWGDLVMMRKQLLTLKRYAEASEKG